MFDLLKKKISGFVKGISEAVGAKPEQETGAPKTDAAKTARTERTEQEITATISEKEIPAPAEEAEISAPAQEKEIGTAYKPQVLIEERPEPAEIPVAEKKIEQRQREAEKQVIAQEKIAEKQKPIEKPGSVVAKVAPVAPAPIPKAEQTASTIAKKAEPVAPATTFAPKFATKPAEAEKKRDIAPDLGLFSKLKGMLTNQVEITEPETRQMFDELEMALLESDVSPDTAQALVEQLKKSLVGRKVAKSEVEKTINEAVASAITSVFTPAPDILQMARQKKAKGEVLKIMFLGPNGAGKTTTIAKLSSLFKQNGLDVVVSASDTFRAAAIEQSAIHAERIGVKLVKQNYGADPAAVAFDAIKHAQSAGAAVVLIDTAGRQETNRNLVEEMKKIDRVAKPDYKIFIGEALAGHALVEQIKSFDAAVGVDAIILTKIDCDAKGGNSISIAHDARKPILFFGVGQEYGDLVPFDSGYIAAKVLEA